VTLRSGGLCGPVTNLQLVPQFSILPDSSQSNVVVEPSGFLDITNYTSQQLEEEEDGAMEMDSSNDEAAAASPPPPAQP